MSMEELLEMLAVVAIDCHMDGCCCYTVYTCIKECKIGKSTYE